MMQNGTKSPVIARDFAHRLDVACDNSDRVPPFNYGRQSFIATELEKLYSVKVSKETVRKWFAGEARPRPDKMKALAALLKVDEAWLSLGSRPDVGVEDRKLRSAVTEGAIHLAVGIFTMNGANCSFPEPGDARGERTHFFTIISGKFYEVYVSAGVKTRDGYKFIAPNGFEQSLCLGVVQRGPTQFDLYCLTTPAISKFGNRRGGYVELSTTDQGGDLHAKDEPLPKIVDFKALGR